ncbi:MAG: cyclic nucleotide-binding domain-containing protein [Gammaproteobacteria bacterium]|nr:cyclic nucleotide-binding domain-containing protein [Gammaproteobacteria bacterium]
MSTPVTDPKLLSGFVPIDSLSDEPLRKLMAKATLHEVAAGQTLFPEGSNDGDTFYVLSGEVALNSKKTGASRVVQGGTDSARYALSNLKPRQFTGTAKTAARILRVDAHLLDTLLTWDQMAGIEVTEFEGDEHDSIWMQRLLESRALLRLPSTSIQSLFEHFEEVPMKTGQLIIRQGEPGDYYYVIKQGRCRVVQKPGSEQKMVALADLAEGDGFGEEALLSEAPRNATIAALTDGSLMRLAKADFVTLLKEPMLERINDKEAVARVQAGAGLIDVRLEGEFQRANLKGSVNIPLARLRQQVESLDRNRRYVVYCDTGKRSMAAAYLLSERGFDVAVLKDGINALIKANPATA